MNICYESSLDALVKQIKPLDILCFENSKRRWTTLAKPLSALGQLETNITKICAVQHGKCNIRKKAIVVFCADNGVVDEHISQTDSSTTAIVAKNMVHNKASICFLASKANAKLQVVDIGMKEPILDKKILSLSLMKGTKNFVHEPSMPLQCAIDTILIGASLAHKLYANGYKLVVAGEMGIGNTTTSAACISALLHKSGKETSGRGAGLSKEALAHKANVIDRALALHKNNLDTPLGILSCLGGLDIAAMVGFYLGSAKEGMICVLDGLISQAAALLAASLCPASLSYMIASHANSEPASLLALNALSSKDATIIPVLRANLALGEGSGAAFVLPILDMACKIYRKLPTFDSVNIEAYKPFS